VWWTDARDTPDAAAAAVADDRAAAGRRAGDVRSR